MVKVGVGVSKPNVCDHLFSLMISEEPQKHSLKITSLNYHVHNLSGIKVWSIF